MDTGAIITIVISVCTVVIGIIGFFLKRTFNRVDQLDQCKASREELSTLSDRVEAQGKTIGDIQTSYLTKEDFFREQAKTDRKLDRIMEILLDIKGGGKHE